MTTILFFPAQKNFSINSQVRQEFSINKQNFRLLANAHDPFVEYYKRNPGNRSLFLCIIWLVTIEHKRTEGLPNILKNFPRIFLYNKFFEEFLQKF